MDRLDDETLWRLARSRKSPADLGRYDQLLERGRSAALTQAERLDLATWRAEADRFVLRKAHAAVLLRWRRHDAPAP